MMKLCDLDDGKLIIGDSKAPVFPPDGFDMKKFDRGRIFFRDHILSCATIMMFSLVLGMGIPELLKALIFTGKSNFPQKALRRYLVTFRHVALWHSGNVWETNSEAQKSICYVRDLHNKIRSEMEDNASSTCTNNENFNEGRIFLSQYDMGIVQSGFMGCIIMYPDKFGIKCSLKDIDDYVYFWYGIGHLLGIEKKFNICAHGMPQALLFCKEIEEVVTEKLRKPSSDFDLMANAVIDGFSSERKVFTLLSFPVIQYLCYEAMSRKIKSLGGIDRVRYCLWKGLFFCTKHFSWFNKLIEKVVVKLFNLKFTI